MSAGLRELRQEYRRLINSVEYAYAMGHSRTLGDDPRLAPVLARVAELERLIGALRDAEGESRPPGLPREPGKPGEP